MKLTFYYNILLTKLKFKNLIKWNENLPTKSLIWRISDSAEHTVKRSKIIDSPFLSHFDDGSVWQSVIFDQAGGFCAQPLLHLGVVSDVTHFLLHYPDRLKVGRVVEGVTAQLHSTDQVLETMKTIN